MIAMRPSAILHAGRIPASVAHVGLLGPGLAPGVERIDLVEALVVDRAVWRSQVAAEHHQPPVGGEGLAGAPDVGRLEHAVGGIAPQRRIDPLGSAGRRIPQPRLRGVRSVATAAVRRAKGSWDRRTTSPCPSATWPRGCPSPGIENGAPQRPTCSGGAGKGGSGLHTRPTGGLSGRQLPIPLRTPQTRMFGRVLGPQRGPLERTQLALGESRHAKLTTRVVSPGRRRARREGQERERRCGDPLSDAGGSRRPAPEYSGSRPASPCYPCQASGAALVSGGADAIHLHSKVTRLPGSRKASRARGPTLSRPPWQPPPLPGAALLQGSRHPHDIWLRTLSDGGLAGFSCLESVI